MEEEKGWEHKGWAKKAGMGWRISTSIVSFFGLLIFVIVWLFFFAEGYSVYQNLAILIVAFLAFIGINGATWATMWTRF